jgi:hypothetical protein
VELTFSEAIAIWGMIVTVLALDWRMQKYIPQKNIPMNWTVLGLVRIDVLVCF